MSKQQKSEAIRLFATAGALTGRGGRVSQATSVAQACGLVLARLGNTVPYEHGNETASIDRAGNTAVRKGKRLALVGRYLSNGDRFGETLQDFLSITIDDDQRIPGLFDPAHVANPAGVPLEGRSDA